MEINKLELCRFVFKIEDSVYRVVIEIPAKMFALHVTIVA